MRYAIVVEQAGENYSAYVPDLPGCVATGATQQEAEAQLREAIAFHVQGLREDGLTVPEPSSKVDYVELADQSAGNSVLRDRPDDEGGGSKVS